MIKKISDRKELQNLKKAMNPRIQNNFYVEPFKNVRMKQMNYNGFCMEVLLSLYLYSIFVPYFDLYFFMIVVAVSLSFGFLRCKGMAVLSDTKHQAMPYSAKTFPEHLPQMLHIWVFQKTFYRIVWCSDSWEPPFLNARKKAI
jgi:hypothetical protein